MDPQCWQIGVYLPAVETIHPKRNKFAMDEKIKAMDVNQNSVTALPSQRQFSGRLRTCS